MTCCFRNFSTMLIFVGWQFVGLAMLVGQSTPQNPFRSAKADGGVVLNFSDPGVEDNPLRASAAPRQSSNLRPSSTSLINDNKSTTQIKQSESPPKRYSSPKQHIRQVNYQEDLDELTDEPPTSEFDQLSEPDDLIEPSNSVVIAPALSTPSNVRAPIRDNPFAEARQHDPQGLLIQPLEDSPRFIVENYSDVTGIETAYHLARYNAHGFHHNPLYFEELNLERYGNALKFPHLTSATKFLSNAALLPIRLVHSPACSRVTTLGHRRPGELVPYRHYDRLTPYAASSHPQRLPRHLRY